MAAMMRIRKVRVGVLHRLMAVLMAMFSVRCNRGIVVMPVVFIMGMFMAVFHGHMRVRVHMSLG